MQVKVVPEPPASLDDVASVRDALPRVPRSERDCCARLADRVGWIEDRDAAREWLVFCYAVGLANRTPDGGYVRSESRPANDDDGPTSDGLDRESLVDGFRDGVFGARVALEALDEGAPAAGGAGGPRTVDDVLAALEPVLPAWERLRRSDPAGTWRERVRRLLEWWVLLGDARTVEGGYVRRED